MMSIFWSITGAIATIVSGTLSLFSAGMMFWLPLGACMALGLNWLDAMIVSVVILLCSKSV